MNLRHLSFPFLLLLCLPTALPGSSTPTIQKGDSLSQTISILGTPLGSIEKNNQQHYFFRLGTVIIENQKVVSTTLMSEASYQTVQEKREANREALQLRLARDEVRREQAEQERRIQELELRLAQAEASNHEQKAQAKSTSSNNRFQKRYYFPRRRSVVIHDTQRPRKSATINRTLTSNLPGGPTPTAVTAISIHESR